MRIPYSWLLDYVACEASAEEVADRLTFSGTEIEGLERVGHAYDRIVAAEILAVEPHPDAHSLVVCRVTDGKDVVPVVCGAKNARAGDKAVLAQPGAVLPGGAKIRVAKLRGVESRGMLCAEDELGLSSDHSGIMILPRETRPGAPFGEIAGPPETVLVAEVTPNRPDCLSLIGIAREVAALYALPLRLPPVDFAEEGGPVGAHAAVSIQDPADCPRYTARVLAGVRVGPSPAWLRRRLELAGVRPISNIVDVTNYVMLECGQPLHAFDHSLLEGGRIVVRRPAPGEVLTTLDGASQAITPEMLVIADGARPVALAGVMGGLSSEIRDTTATVLLESACFKPALIRRTAKALGVSTESSYRFERGVDPNLADWASRRAARLMIETAGAVAAKGVVDEYPRRAEPARVPCRYGRVRALIGMDIPAAEMHAVFERLGMRVAEPGAESCVVEAPTFRPDLVREADLVEEVARIHGLDRIPIRAPVCKIISGVDDAPARAVQRCRAALAGLGLTEIMNYSFTSERLLDLFDAAGGASRVRLPNPMSADHSVLRPSLVPQLVETLGRNRARQVDDAAVFEIGRAFVSADGGAYGEAERLAIGLLGKPGRAVMDRRRPVGEQEMFGWMKGLVEALARALRLPRRREGGLEVPALEFEPAGCAWAEPGMAVEVRLAGRACGAFGLVRAAVRAEWRLAEPVAAAELDVAPLVAHVFGVPAARAVPPYPCVQRDTALVVDEAVTHADVVRAIRQFAPPELVDVRLFDVFRGAALGAGRKSMAYSLTYQSGERTLTDEEVNGYDAVVKAGMTRTLHGEIRE